MQPASTATKTSIDIAPRIADVVSKLDQRIVCHYYKYDRQQNKNSKNYHYWHRSFLYFLKRYSGIIDRTWINLAMLYSISLALSLRLHVRAIVLRSISLEIVPR